MNTQELTNELDSIADRLHEIGQKTVATHWEANCVIKAAESACFAAVTVLMRVHGAQLPPRLDAQLPPRHAVQVAAPVEMAAAPELAEVMA